MLSIGTKIGDLECPSMV